MRAKPLFVLVLLIGACLLMGHSSANMGNLTNGVEVVTDNATYSLMCTGTVGYVLSWTASGAPFIVSALSLVSSLTNGVVFYVGVPLVTTNPITALNTSYTNQTRGVIQVSITLNSLLAAQASCWMFQYPTNTTGLVRTNNIDFAQGPSIASTTIQTLQGTVYQGYIVKVVDKSSGLGSATLNTESGTGMTVNRITY